MSKKVWFTSDTHFNAERTLQLTKRPFESVEEMNRVIIEKWNATVDENDIVYHLGDFGDYSFVKKLNGSINLVLGNYELTDMKKFASFESFSNYLRGQGFSKVYLHNCLCASDLGFINLTHKPSDCKKGVFNLFGHVHKLCMVKQFGLNVGVDCHNYTPISMETISHYKNGIEFFYDEEVFMQELDE